MGAEVDFPAFVRLLKRPLCGGVSNRGPDVKEAALVAKDVVPEFLGLVQFCCRGQVNSFRDVLAPPLVLAACLFTALGMSRLFAAPQLLEELFAFRFAPWGEFVGRRAVSAAVLFEGLLGFPELRPNVCKLFFGRLQLRP